jgi:hypothetical protein
MTLTENQLNDIAETSTDGLRNGVAGHGRGECSLAYSLACCAELDRRGDVVWAFDGSDTLRPVERTCTTCIGAGVLPAEFGGEVEFGAEVYPCYSCQPAAANL